MSLDEFSAVEAAVAVLMQAAKEGLAVPKKLLACNM